MTEPAATIATGRLTTFKVKAIDHVTVVVADLERSRQFYVDALGMEQVARPAFNFPGLWFQAGATQVHLILQHDKSSPAGTETPPSNAATGRVGHFAFEVDDAPKAAEELVAAGVRLRGGPSTRPDGCLQVWAYDPDGHVVEIFSRP